MSDESDLYSGVSSQMFNDQESRTNQEAKNEQDKQAAVLLPSANELTRIIQLEREAVSDFRAYMTTLGTNPTGEDIHLEYRARELYMGFLDRLESAIDSRVKTMESQNV